MASSEQRARLGRRWALAAIAACAPLAGLSACNAIAGLDAFDKRDCVYCGPDGGPPPDAIGPALDGPPDTLGNDARVGRDGAPDVDAAPAVDTRRLWARWPIERADAGADGSTLEVDDAGVIVRDKVTGLTWEQGFREATTIQAAVQHCDSLSPKMTLPSRIELVSILDFGRGAGSPLASAVFAAPTSTSALYWALNGWSVDFKTGAVQRSAGAYVRCVRLEDAGN